MPKTYTRTRWKSQSFIIKLHTIKYNQMCVYAHYTTSCHYRNVYIYETWRTTENNFFSSFICISFCPQCLLKIIQLSKCSNVHIVFEYGLLHTIPNIRAWIFFLFRMCMRAYVRNICPHIHWNEVVQFKLMLFKHSEWKKKLYKRTVIEMITFYLYRIKSYEIYFVFLVAKFNMNNH